MKKDEERHFLTLREAYRLWGEQEQYRVLYNRTKVSFRDTWAALDLDKPCAHYTLEVLGAAIKKGRGIYQSKVKASSVMQHVLHFAHVIDAEHCPAVSFTYNEILEFAKAPVQPKVQEVMLKTPKREVVRKNEMREKRRSFVKDLMKKTSVDLRSTESKAVEDVVAVEEVVECSETVITINEGKSGHQESFVDFNGGTDTQNTENINIKTEEIMKESKKSKLAKKVVQIDAVTLKAIKTWDSISLAQRECNASNIGRAIASRSAAGGFYWCFAGDEEHFQPHKVARKYTPRKKNNQVEKRESKEDVAIPAMEPAASSNLPALIKKDFDLTEVSDEELIAEIRRRGWKGDLDVVKRVTL